MEVIRPMRVQLEAAARSGEYQPRIVEVALRDQHQLAATLDRKLMHRRRQILEHVHRLEAENRVHRVQPQAVEAVIPEPHERVVDDEPAYLVAIRTVVVDRLRPRAS